MRNKWKVSVLLCALGCGGDDPPPSCQDAMTSFYGVGCSFFNLSTNPPTPYSLNESIAACQQINIDVPERCRSFFDDFKICLDGVAYDSQCGDCSGEQDALFGCD